MARSPISLATLALAGCVLAGGVACSDSGASTPATDGAPSGASVPSSTNDATTSVAAQNAAAPAALQFAASLVGGGTIDFTQYAGQTLALWFWAPT